MRIQKRTFRSAFIPIVVLIALILLPTGAQAGTKEIYGDSLRWDNWSWNSTLDPNATSPAHSGSKSLAITYWGGWAGASFYTGDALSTSPYTHLQFALHPNGRPLPQLTVGLHGRSGALIKSVGIAAFTTTAGSGWHIVSIPLTVLNAANSTVTRVTVQEGTGSAQPTFYIDDLEFVAASATSSSSGFIYGDSLAWANWSWGASLNPAVTWPVHAGAKSLAVTYNRAWAGASFYNGSGINTSPYSHLRFEVHPNGKPLPKIRVDLYDSASRRTNSVAVGPHTTSAGNGWHAVSIPLSTLNATGITVKRIAIQEAAGATQPTFYIDNLRFSSGGHTVATSTASSNASGTTPRPTGSFRPAQAPKWIDDIVRDSVARYNLPRWFYYAIIQRESSFDPNQVGSGNDLGLTQLGSINYYGSPYPMGLSSPVNNHQQYGWDMNFRKFGMWLRMDQISHLYDPFDPRQNLDRFSTGYAVPAFNLFKKRYGRSDTETLRMVAFFWNKGLYLEYDPNNRDYLEKYDQHVNEFKPKVENEDGRWNGKPHLP